MVPSDVNFILAIDLINAPIIDFDFLDLFCGE